MAKSRDPERWSLRAPGTVGTVLLILTTTLWTYWSFGELYHEGWGLPWPVRLAYLVPAAACWLFTALVLVWPLAGGLLLILAGGAFTAWWLSMMAGRLGGLSLGNAAAVFPVSGLLVVTGLLFLVEARRRRELRAAGRWPRPSYWRRHARLLLGLGIPLFAALAISAVRLPVVLGRVDDGDRGARRIAGTGVDLVWAPRGPGWNWKQPWGGYPSWDSIARYGEAPVGIDKPREAHAAGHATAGTMNTTGLCAYLTEDGSALAETPTRIWRMPTADEIVRSLVRGGANAGCVWNGEVGSRADCRLDGEKETPLWAPDEYPIYYWAADEAGPDRAVWVSYNGWVQSQPKDWGNPRHGYRCVKPAAP